MLISCSLPEYNSFFSSFQSLLVHLWNDIFEFSFFIEPMLHYRLVYGGDRLLREYSLDLDRWNFEWIEFIGIWWQDMLGTPWSQLCFQFTLILVTDVGDQLCRWLAWDFGDRFSMLVTDIKHWENHQYNEKSRQHNDSATNNWNQSPS